MLQMLTRTDFVNWLRTGCCPVPDEIELKFNPWHDPRDGRFTFAGSGRFYGWMQGGFTGGGGGSAGGGGASGRWEAPPPKFGPRAKKRGSVSDARIRPAPLERSTGPRGRLDAQPARQPAMARLPISPHAFPEPGPMWSEISRNGYSFRLDGARRTIRASGTLVLNPAQGRSRTAQRTAGGRDRLPTDHGGHYIGRQFNGPTDAFNHFAQDAKFNVGAYRALEDEWAAAIRRGEKVSVVITPGYLGTSSRPVTIDVRYRVGTEAAVVSSFENPSGYGREVNGKR